jgi:pimeloyl-ACP methyl ester carboxylesterase
MTGGINLSHDEAAKQGPLAAYAGAVPPAPAWFARALAVKPEPFPVTSGGVRLNALRWGEKTKPGLVFVHGNGAHAWWWAFLAPYLADDYNVAAFDLSGMGDSEWRDRYAMRAFGQEIHDVAEHAGMFAHAEPPVIVGHSFGGFATMLAASQFGAKLAGAVLVDSPVNPPGRPGGPPNREMRPHRIYATIEDALARFRLAPAQECENHYAIDYVARGSLKRVQQGWTWKFDPAIWQRFEAGDTAEVLRAISCRTAIMRGDLSFLMPKEVSGYMFHLLGRAVPVIDVPEARHHIMLDQPLAFVAALRALLADWNHSRPNRRL